MDGDAVREAFRLARESATEVVDVAGVPTLVTATGAKPLAECLEVADRRASAPRSRTGTAHLHELAAFVAHVNRFKAPESAVFADVTGRKLVAIYDYHPGGEDPASAAWCRHRAEYTCPLSEPWLAWNAAAGELMSLDTFAELIEDRFDDLHGEKGYPDPLDVLGLARNFEMATNGVYKRRTDPRTGNYTLVCQQTTDESASTTVPRAFLVALPVFEGGALRLVEARVKLKTADGKPSIGFDLHRVREHMREAFAEVRTTVAESTGLPVFAGTPEG